jgi:uncharacterized membrane protein
MPAKVSKTFTLTLTSILVALEVVLTFTPIGTVSLGIISGTIMAVPVLVGTVVFGLKIGLVLGFSFGAATLVKAVLVGPGIIDLLFINPLVSILPRLLIPIACYYSYISAKKLLKNNELISIAIAALIGNLTNTVGVFLALSLLYAKNLAAALGADTPLAGVVTFASFLVAVAISESVLAVVITPTVSLAIKKYMK